MIEVTQEDDNTFTISWDENDPQESMFNTWTEEDFINAIQDKLKALEELGVVDNATQAINEINDHIEEEVITTCEETFGKECYDEEFWQDYHNNTAEKKDTTLYEFINQTPEEVNQDIQTLKDFITNQDTEQSQT